MKRWSIAALPLLVACSNGAGDDAIPVPSDSDTDVPGDTFVLSTDLPEHTDPFQPIDTDTGFAPIDTADCRFGEVLDCGGTCFPDWFLGDGHCDDGGMLPADFNCVDHHYDAGDCLSDTDPHTDTGGVVDCGEHVLRIFTGGTPYDIGWEIRRVVGGVPESTPLYRATAGTYATPNTTVEQDVLLPPGTYEFTGTDAWPYDAGWWGGFVEIIDKRTGQYALETTADDFTSVTSVFRFTTSCVSHHCPLEVTTFGGADAGELSWELATAAGLTEAFLPPGTVADGAERVDVVDAFTGRYVLSQRDLAGDGWQGGHVEVRYEGGLLLNAGGLPSGALSSLDLRVDCSLAGQPAADAPGPALTPSTCDQIAFNVVGGADRQQMAWALHRADDWSLVVERRPGHYTASPATPATVALTPGRYFVRMTDSAGDGWQDARLRIEDPATSTLLLQPAPTLPGGASSGFYFDLACPPIDTAPPEDTDVPGPTCLPNATLDCDGVCFPVDFIGDGSCDDGANSSANFACEAFDFDDGDCAP